MWPCVGPERESSLGGVILAAFCELTAPICFLFRPRPSLLLLFWLSLPHRSTSYALHTLFIPFQGNSKWSLRRGISISCVWMSIRSRPQGCFSSAYWSTCCCFVQWPWGHPCTCCLRYRFFFFSSLAAAIMQIPEYFSSSWTNREIISPSRKAHSHSAWETTRDLKDTRFTSTG